MYNDTMKRKWKDAMKVHEILKAFQHTQNTVKSIAFIYTARHRATRGKYDYNNIVG